MRRAVILTIALALAACDDDNPAGPSNSGPIVFTSQLSAANEVPPVTNAESGGRGTVTITFAVPRDNSGNPTGGGDATFQVQLNGFPPNTTMRAAHIHPGAAGVNGSPLVNTDLTAASPLPLPNGSGTRTLTGTVTQQQATDIMANPANFYFNVHSALNPGGAARGQLARQQ